MNNLISDKYARLWIANWDGLNIYDASLNKRKKVTLIMLKENGDTPLNLVRNRAGLAAIMNTAVKGLNNKRRDELAGEFADKRFDLVHWRYTKEIYSKPLHGRIHKERSDPNSSYNVKETWFARNFDASYMNVWLRPNQSVNSS